MCIFTGFHYAYNHSCDSNKQYYRFSQHEKRELSDTLRQKLENVKVDYSDYLDSSVMQPLPQNIRDDETISVIVTLDVPTVMDAYEASAKTMSILDFASGAEGEKVRQLLAAQKAQMGDGHIADRSDRLVHFAWLQGALAHAAGFSGPGIFPHPGGGQGVHGQIGDDRHFYAADCVCFSPRGDL